LSFCHCNSLGWPVVKSPTVSGVSHLTQYTLSVTVSVKCSVSECLLATNLVVHPSVTQYTSSDLTHCTSSDTLKILCRVTRLYEAWAHSSLGCAFCCFQIGLEVGLW